MTAKEVLDQTFDKHEWRRASFPYYESEDATLDAMQEYAKLKCKELLEIVVEKAEVYRSEGGYEDYVDKDSILNCVDLEKFCS